ncbi:MAG: phosphodiester glycosidase family protein [Rikenellaceae bacterium]
MRFNELVKLAVLTLAPVVFCSFDKAGGEPVLKETEGWKIDSIAPGYILYSFLGEYEPYGSGQSVNVLEFDLNVEGNTLGLLFVEEGDSLSSVAGSLGSFAGINGTYEPDGSYFKADGKFYIQNELPEGDLRFWKHEGALFFDNNSDNLTISYCTDEEYRSSPFQNIISGSPMLVDNYNPVGESFVSDTVGISLNSLEYEDYRRHQGVRHPRTAVALTDDGKLLLITVDGRQRPQLAAGMSAKELTQFIVKYFAPKSALNIDGGGSTTMWIDNYNADGSGVVNYPTDNKKFDHYGQRRVTTFVLLNRK